MIWSELHYIAKVGEDPIIFQLSYGIEQANTYILISNGRAIIIDMCSKKIAEEVANWKLIIDYVFLTHEHVDHLWGLNCLRKSFPEIKVIAHEKCSEAIVDPKTNKAEQYRIYAILRFGKDYQNAEAENKQYFCEPADIVFSDIYEIQWQRFKIKVIHTPGHSVGNCLIFLNEDLVFSGDTMLNEDTFLKFDGGNKKQFSMITLPIIQVLLGRI